MEVRFGNCQCQSAMKLQLRLLNTPLDQFIESSDVGELFDLSPSLTALNFCLVKRRVCFVVGVIFVQWRCWSKPPQIRDGLIALCLPNSRFIHQLWLSALEGDDLSLELVIELPQLLLFMNGVLVIESHLLSIAI